jgi:hypothetical protein
MVRLLADLAADIAAKDNHEKQHPSSCSLNDQNTTSRDGVV